MHYLVDDEQIFFGQEEKIDNNTFVTKGFLQVIEFPRIINEDKFLHYYTDGETLIHHNEDYTNNLDNKKLEKYEIEIMKVLYNYFTFHISQQYPLENQNYDFNEKYYLLEVLNYKDAIQLVNAKLKSKNYLQMPTAQKEWKTLMKIQFKMNWLQEQKDTLSEFKLNINRDGSDLMELRNKLTILSLPEALK